MLRGIAYTDTCHIKHDNLYVFCSMFVVNAVMGKAEGHGENWHGHVTALTVAPEFRRIGLAGKLMNILEEISET